MASTHYGSASIEAQRPQINSSAIQRFLLSAWPVPVLPAHVVAKSPADRNEGIDTRRERSGWKPRIVAIAGQFSSRDSGSRTFLREPEPGSDGGGEMKTEKTPTISTSGEVPGKRNAGSQDFREDSTKGSKSKSAEGRDLETAVAVSCGLRTVEEQGQ